MKPPNPLMGDEFFFNLIKIPLRKFYIINKEIVIQNSLFNNYTKLKLLNRRSVKKCLGLHQIFRFGHTDWNHIPSVQPFLVIVQFFISSMDDPLYIGHRLQECFTIRKEEGEL